MARKGQTNAGKGGKAAAAKRGKRNRLPSYPLTNNMTIKAGDSVLLRPEGKGLPYVGKIQEIFTEGDQILVNLQWYYRPEEAYGGRQKFHGKQEVFLSDHFDIEPVEAIQRKCNVYDLKSYSGLPRISDADFFCRFTYKASTQTWMPDQVTVYCKCEEPQNPDKPMVLCDGCGDWYHLSCINVTKKQVDAMDSFYCMNCPQPTAKKRRKR